ncbi:MAG TPA: hypothetical protein VIO36_11845 [Anaerolineaceae bacterium]
MDRKTQSIRTGIRRQKAEEYLLITMLSFAASVAVTRLFLFLTGYPQIGGGTLHIAHVLWGGLLLFVASLLPLLLANRWAFTLSALISGVGVGLFIDEVGKFITSNNDYFFPWAAPIIYVFFLLTVALYLRVNRPRPDDYRTELYYTLEDLQELLDHDLSEREKKAILGRLTRVRNLSRHPDLIALATSLEEFIHTHEIEVVPEEPTRWQHFLTWLEATEGRLLNRKRYRAVLSGVLVALAAWALYYPFVVISAAVYNRPMNGLILELVENELVNSDLGITWYSTMLALQVSAGLVILIGAVLTALGRDRRGFSFVYFGLLFSLTVVNVLVFYFDQFSTIANSILQFGALLLLLRYRQKFMQNYNAPV